jgi:hypothetical protein
VCRGAREAVAAASHCLISAASNSSTVVFPVEFQIHCSRDVTATPAARSGAQLRCSSVSIRNRKFAHPPSGVSVSHLLRHTAWQLSKETPNPSGPTPVRSLSSASTDSSLLRIPKSFIAFSRWEASLHASCIIPTKAQNRQCALFARAAPHRPYPSPPVDGRQR